MRFVKILPLFLTLVIYLFPALAALPSKIANVATYDSYRYNAWIESLAVFAESPVFGYGMAAYYDYLPMGVFSWFLQLLVEVGLMGLLCLLFFFLHFLFILIKQGRLIYAFSVVGFLVQMVSMNHYYIPGIWVLIGFVHALNQGDPLWMRWKKRLQRQQLYHKKTKNYQ